MAEPIIPGKKPSEVPSKAYSELDSEALIPVSDVQGGVRKDATIKVMQLAPKSHLTSETAHLDIRNEMKPFSFDFDTGDVNNLIEALQAKRRIQLTDMDDDTWDIVQADTISNEGGVFKIRLTGLTGNPDPILARFDFTLEGGNWVKSQNKWEMVAEAPKDSKTYGRKDADWVEVTSGIPDAPSDHTAYCRKDGEWVGVEFNDMFVATPDETTAEELVEAIDAGKAIAIDTGAGQALVSHSFYEDDFVGLVFAGFPTSAVSQPGLFVYRIARSGDDWEIAQCHPWEAPKDGNVYGRKDGAWVEVGGGGDVAEIGELTYGTSSFVEAANAIAQYKAILLTLSSHNGVIVTGYSASPDTIKFASVKHDGTVNLYIVDNGDNWTETAKTYVEDAPADHKQYARKDNGWEEVTGGGEGVPEAPEDGKTYGRKDADWVEITGGSDNLVVLEYGTSTRAEAQAALASGKLIVMHFPETGTTSEWAAPVVGHDNWDSGIMFTCLAVGNPSAWEPRPVNCVLAIVTGTNTWTKDFYSLDRIACWVVEYGVTQRTEMEGFAIGARPRFIRKQGNNRRYPVIEVENSDYSQLIIHALKTDDSGNAVMWNTRVDRRSGAWSDLGEVPLGGGGESKVFIVENETTPYADIAAALTAGKLLVLKKPGGKLIPVTGELDEHMIHLYYVNETPGFVDVAISSEDEWEETVTTALDEAPNDGKQYARQNNAWSEVVAGGASVGEVTLGTSTYAEVVAAFENNDFVKLNVEDEYALVISHYKVDDSVRMLVNANGSQLMFIVSEDDSWDYEITEYIKEAPEDGKQYARKDGSWEEVASGGDVYSGLIEYGETTAEEVQAIMATAFNAKMFPVVSRIPGVSSNNHAALALSIIGADHCQFINCLVLPDNTYPELRVMTVKVNETTNEWAVEQSRDFCPEITEEQKVSGKSYVRTVNTWNNPVWSELDLSTVHAGEVVESGDVFGSGRPTSLFDCSDGSLVANLFDEGIAYTIANCKYEIIKLENNGDDDIELVFGPDSVITVRHGEQLHLKWTGTAAHIMRDGTTVYVSGFEPFLEIVEGQYTIGHTMGAGVFLPDSTGSERVSLMGSFDAVFSGVEPSSAQSGLYGTAHVSFAITATPNRLGEAMGVVNVSGSMRNTNVSLDDFILEHLALKHTQTEEGTVVGIGFTAQSSSEMLMRAVGVDVHAATDGENYTRYKVVSNYVPTTATSSETATPSGVRWVINDMGV